MRIVVTGGGTGGHIFPALEIIKEIQRQNPTIEVIFVGNKNSLEEKMAKNSGILFYGLATKQLIGQSFFKKMLALWYLKWAVFQSIWFLIKKRPLAVIGVGGFVASPMIIGSFFLGINRYICEQNAVPGFANLHLAKIAHRVFISFQTSVRFFNKAKVIYSGNPVRKDFFARVPTIPGETLNILVTGGTLGAQFLNQQVPKVLAQIGKDCPNIRITHQTGLTMKDEVSHFYQQNRLSAKVLTFIDNMPATFMDHDLLISRAGATVCAEIMASGMAAILIPYPFANNHQRYNALALAEQSAGIMLEQSPDFLDRLAETLKTLYSDRKALNQMAKNAKSMGSPKAAFVIVSTILNDFSHK